MDKTERRAGLSGSRRSVIKIDSYRQELGDHAMQRIYIRATYLQAMIVRGSSHVMTSALCLVQNPGCSLPIVDELLAILYLLENETGLVKM